MPAASVTHAYESLVARHEELMDEARQIEAAMAVLAPLAAKATPLRSDRDRNAGVRPRSAKSLMLDLLAESDRDWSVGEVIAEYGRRSVPIHVKDPNNAMRAAVAEANAAGQIFRVSPGRYKAARWRTAYPGTVRLDEIAASPEAPIA